MSSPYQISGTSYPRTSSILDLMPDARGETDPEPSTRTRRGNMETTKAARVFLAALDREAWDQVNAYAPDGVSVKELQEVHEKLMQEIGTKIAEQIIHRHYLAWSPADEEDEA